MTSKWTTGFAIASLLVVVLNNCKVVKIHCSGADRSELPRRVPHRPEPGRGGRALGVAGRARAAAGTAAVRRPAPRAARGELQPAHRPPPRARGARRARPAQAAAPGGRGLLRADRLRPGAGAGAARARAVGRAAAAAGVIDPQRDLGPALP